jgi:hypothetical protein
LSERKASLHRGDSENVKNSINSVTDALAAREVKPFSKAA